MPVTGSLISGGAHVLSGLFGGLVGGGQERKGENLLNSLVYPTESVPQAELDNVALAKQLANQGMPSAQYNKAMQDIQRQQLTALTSAQSRRSALDALPSITNTASNATLGLDAENAKERLANQRQLIGVNNEFANWQDKVWDNNVKQKYIQNYNYAMGLIGAGNQNISNSVDRGIAGLGLGLAGGLGVTPQQYYGNYSGYNQSPNGNTQAPSRF
jgi:hypothetical protein